MRILKANVTQKICANELNAKFTLLFYNECCQISGTKFTF